MIVKVFDPEPYTALQAVNGRCVRCQDRLAWIVIHCHRYSRRRIKETVEPNHNSAM